MSAEALRICRNEIFARHGYAFKGQDLRKLFYETHGRREQNGYVTVAFALNEGWSIELLTEGEKALVARIKQIEASR